MTDASFRPDLHYDRVTEAWDFLLGEELHYGVFETGDETLATATGRLTDLMIEAAGLDEPVHVLDVGCGTGTTACRLARDHRSTVLGITTSQVGVDAATARANRSGLAEQARFERRDATDNGLAGETFDRVWVLESSHLMRQRDRLMSECARVLRPGGRLALCDIMLRRPMTLLEVKARRQPLTLLREIFGDAKMEPLDLYASLAQAQGLDVDLRRDLTSETRPTFERWRSNAERYEDQVAALVGQPYLDRFVESAWVLEQLWDEGVLGYGLLAASRPAA